MLKIPEAFKEAPVTKTEAKAKSARAVESATPVKARVDMSAEVAGEGLCPDCRQPMKECFANSHPVLACPNCRIVIPVKDTVVAES
jgi:hypothetical protein